MRHFSPSEPDSEHRRQPLSSDAAGGGDSGYGSRRPRPVRETIIMHKPAAFEGMGIRSIPLPEFRELAELIGREFGIKIGDNKLTLVTGRMHPMMEKYGFANHRECLEAIRNDKTGQLLSELANRISTNHTAFYREDAHFTLLRDIVLPDLVRKKEAAGSLDLRVWCAACATGEEAYTILFTMLKFFGFDYGRWKAGLLATDISADALDTARRGRYGVTRMEPIPRDVVNLFFDRVDDDSYEVKPEIRKEVTFRRLNLINDEFPFKQRFDAIFCRNVMIYFSRPTRMRLLAKMHDWLETGGYLFMGHSESLIGTHPGYEYVAPALYRRSD